VSDFSIQRITSENTSLLARLAEDVFDDDIASPWLDEYVQARDHALFVALDDDRVIGQGRGVLHRQPDSACDLYIDNLGVAPAQKRRGVATALVGALIAWARAETSCRSVWLATELDNDEARSFYEAAGFKGEDVRYYAKDLPE